MHLVLKGNTTDLCPHDDCTGSWRIFPQIAQLYRSFTTFTNSKVNVEIVDAIRQSGKLPFRNRMLVRPSEKAKLYAKLEAQKGNTRRLCSRSGFPACLFAGFTADLKRGGYHTVALKTYSSVVFLHSAHTFRTLTREKQKPMGCKLNIKQDWLSPVYSGCLQYICRNSFYTDTPLHWCTIRG